MRRTIAIFICFLSLFLSAQTRQLAEFDGSTTILGLFDEPIPASFFSVSTAFTFDSGMNYTTRFKVPTYGQNLLVYLINEEDVELAITISALGSTGQYKNYLVQVPNLDVIELDLASLAGYDQVSLISLGSFQVQSNRVLIQDNRGTLAPSIQAPLSVPEEFVGDQSLLGTDCYAGGREITVSNDAPATSGSKKADAFITNYQDTFGRIHTYLNVYYPFSYYGAAPFHAGSRFHRFCGDGDTYHTLSDARYIRWAGMSKLMESNRSAKAYCEDYPFKECLVEDTQVYASWSIKGGKRI